MSDESTFDVLKQRVAAVKRYAHEHYNEDGWDYVVETFSDEQIAEDLMENLAETPHPLSSDEKAIECIGWLCKLLDDRRRDIQATAF